MGHRKQPGGTPATRALAAAGVAHEVHDYPHEPRAASASRSHGSYGAEAAAHLVERLGIAPEQVLKTLVASVDGALVVAVVPVTGTLDLRALARACGGRRASMADPAAAARATGYVTGGISPLGQRTRLPCVVDESALGHDRVLVSSGRRGQDVALAPGDLVRLTGATLAAVGRPA